MAKYDGRNQMDVGTGGGGMGAGAGNINAGRMGVANKMTEAEYQAALKQAQSAGKIKEIPYQGKPKSDRAIKDADVAKRTDDTTVTKGRVTPRAMDPDFPEYKKGGTVKAASRGDGCAQRGKTKGRMV